MYTGAYNDQFEEQHKAVFNAEIYALAEKYDIKSLKLVAQKRFDSAIANLEFQECLMTKITEAVYANTPYSDRGLRNSIAPLLTRHKTSLRACDSFMDLIRNRLDGDFAVDVIDAWTGARQPPNSSEGPLNPSRPCCYRCESENLYGWCSGCGLEKRVHYQGGNVVCSTCRSGVRNIVCTRCQQPILPSEMV